MRGYDWTTPWPPARLSSEHRRDLETTQTRICMALRTLMPELMKSHEISATEPEEEVVVLDRFLLQTVGLWVDACQDTLEVSQNEATASSAYAFLDRILRVWDNDQPDKVTSLLTDRHSYSRHLFIWHTTTLPGANFLRPSGSFWYHSSSDVRPGTPARCFLHYTLLARLRAGLCSVWT